MNIVEIEWTDIVAAVVVVYGAILSTITFVRQCMREKPRGKVEFGYIDIIGKTQGDNLGCAFELKPSITFKNVGTIRIKIENVGIKLPNKMNIFFINKFIEMPQYVEPGNSITVWAIGDKLVEELSNNDYMGEKTLRCFAKDGIGNIYYSKKFRFNLKQRFK